MFSDETAAFQKRWAERIAQEPLAQRVIATLWRHRAAYIAPVLAQARAANPIIDPVIQSEPQEMSRHVDDHFRALLSLPTPDRRHRDKQPLAFVAAHGVRRARAGVPLRAVLQAYRSGHKSFWSIICQVIDQLARSPQSGMRATMLLSDYCIEYTDLISIVLTDAYVAEEGRMTGERTRLAIAVLDSLLIGELPAHGRGRQMCEACGIADGRTMVVVAARIGDAAAADAGRQGGELATAVERSLASAQWDCLVEPRQGEVVAIVGGSAPVGVRVAQTLRSAAARVPHLLAGAQDIGIGLDVDTVAELPRSYGEAQQAIAFFGPGHGIAHLGDLDVNAYLHRTADATARRLLPRLPNEVRQAPLADTLEAFALANLNVKACARRLGVHTNTIYHRLNRIERLSGYDPRQFGALAELMTALKMV